jgi:hypothetical protein
MVMGVDDARKAAKLAREGRGWRCDSEKMCRARRHRKTDDGVPGGVALLQKASMSFVSV